ncbi:MAG: glucuronate isomerase, partial [Rubritalea sp.]|uniref:glucuronate isomerase n=1 Tax=Rubritalea sp. TaxID=2109375 RepID=UPI003242C39C
IIDFHTHLNQQEILDDHHFANLWELWLKHDHYKWRLMRGCGVAEEFVTGSASPWEKFHAFASIMPLAVGNPVHHWAHLELQRVFDIDTVLTADTAEEIWNKTNAQLLSNPELGVRGLLKRFNVSLVCTTDDPACDLSVHQRLAAEDTARTLPTYRPDVAMAIDKPEQYSAWLKQLGQRCNTEITDYSKLLQALKQRHDDFHAVGCRLSDHGIPFCPTGESTPQELNAIFHNAALGNAPNRTEDWSIFAADIMRHVAEWNSEKQWTMQLHLGPLRNVNKPLFKRIGPDSGLDTMGAWPQTQALVDFLSSIQEKATLPRTIVYNLNPNESAAICCALQSFQDETCPGKIQYGPAWWHLDHKRGIIEQLDILMSLGAIGTSVGMLTDSRSFTSYVRHEYFRRLLCQLIGKAVEDGEIPDDKAQLNKLISDICYRNANEYFQWPANHNN